MSSREQIFTETGLLLQSGRALVLATDGGGEWQLDAGLHDRRLLGQHVQVVGRRSGFDRLDVTSIVNVRAGEAIPRRAYQFRTAERAD